MAKCNNCGADLKPGKQFCTECGTKIDGTVSQNEVPTNAEEQHELADKYYYGRGVPKEDVKAVYWYFKAAEHGYTGAREIIRNSIMQNMR